MLFMVVTPPRGSQTRLTESHIALHPSGKGYASAAVQPDRYRSMLLFGSAEYTRSWLLIDTSCLPNGACCATAQPVVVNTSIMLISIFMTSPYSPAGAVMCASMA